MQIVDISKEYKCCCSCVHNIRKKEKNSINCYCEIDNHYIGCVACFESVCEEWKDGNERDEV